MRPGLSRPRHVRRLMFAGGSDSSCSLSDSDDDSDDASSVASFLRGGRSPRGHSAGLNPDQGQGGSSHYRGDHAGFGMKRALEVDSNNSTNYHHDVADIGSSISRQRTVPLRRSFIPRRDGGGGGDGGPMTPIGSSPHQWGSPSLAPSVRQGFSDSGFGSLLVAPPSPRSAASPPSPRAPSMWD